MRCKACGAAVPHDCPKCDQLAKQLEEAHKAFEFTKSLWLKATQQSVALSKQLRIATEAIDQFDARFNRYGNIIEGDGWQQLGPEAWVELVLAMDELRAAHARAKENKS